MPVFPSKEWFETAVRLTNADPESAEATDGWVGDLGAVIEAESGCLPRPFVVHCVPAGGKIGRLRILDDPDDLEELEPAYLARAPYSVWKGLLKGTVDPIEAVLRRRLSLKGDVQPIIERMRYKGIAERVLSKIQTIYMDEGR